MSSRKKQPKQLKPRAEAIAICIAQGMSNIATAAKCGVNEKTVRRAKLNRAVKARIGELKGEASERAFAIINDALPEQAEQLVADCKDPDRRRRLAARKQLFAMWLKMRHAAVADAIDELLIRAQKTKEVRK